jgi:hypothetical protein
MTHAQSRCRILLRRAEWNLAPSDSNHGQASNRRRCRDGQGNHAAAYVIKLGVG